MLAKQGNTFFKKTILTDTDPKQLLTDDFVRFSYIHFS